MTTPDPKTWRQEFLDCLARRDTLERADFIEEIARLAFAIPEADADACLDRETGWLAHREAVTRLYYDHIVAMETQEVARLLGPLRKRGLSYREVASEKGLVSYLRVADMFEHVDFGRCRRFVMVGCGQLPVTALHVMDRTNVRSMVLLDVSPRAVKAVEHLRAAYGWDALEPRLCSGRDFDFRDADVVYIGNMVSPKLETLQRVLDTAPQGVQIVLREPYSLGRLWAEKAEAHLPEAVAIVGRGPVSRHLSRDLYLLRKSRP